jgi:hypothetical protein
LNKKSVQTRYILFYFFYQTQKPFFSMIGFFYGLFYWCKKNQFQLPNFWSIFGIFLGLLKFFNHSKVKLLNFLLNFLTNQLTYQIEKRNTKQKSKKPSMYHWKLELIQVRLWFLLLVGITHMNVSSSEILQHSLYHLGNKGSITQKHYIFYLQQSLAFFRQQSIIITKKKTLNKVKLAHRWGRRLRERREQKI